MTQKNSKVSINWRIFRKKYVIALSITILMSLVSYFGIIRQYENWWLDLSLRLKGHASPEDFPIVVVGIDDRTLIEWGYPEPVQVSITPRKELAGLIRSLTVDKNLDLNIRPAVVAADIFFDTHAEGTEALQSVVDEISRSPEAPRLVLGRLAIIKNNRIVELAPTLIEPTDRISLGLINIGAERFDRVVRWFQPKALFDDEEIPSFGLLVANHYREAESQPLVDPGEDNFANLQIQFLGPSSSFPYVSAADAEKAALEGRLADKIVLIGRTDSGTGDYHPTPIMPVTGNEENLRNWQRAPNDEMYGVEIQANVVATLLSESLVPEPGFFNEFLIEVLCFCPFLSLLFALSIPALKRNETQIQLGIIFVYFIVLALISPTWKYLTNPLPSVIGVFIDSIYSTRKEKRRIVGTLTDILGRKTIEHILKESHSNKSSFLEMILFIYIPAGNAVISQRRKQNLSRYVIGQGGGVVGRGDVLVAYLPLNDINSVIREIFNLTKGVKGPILLYRKKVFRNPDLFIPVLDERVAGEISEMTMNHKAFIDTRLLNDLDRQYIVGSESFSIDTPSDGVISFCSISIARERKGRKKDE